jgi:hypothetical protein
MAFGTPQSSGDQFAPYRAGFVNLPPQAPAYQAPIAQAVQFPKMNPILGILADALAGAAGKEGPYAAMMGQQRQLTMQEALYQQHQQQEFERQRQMYDYQRQNPNDETTQLIRQSGVDPSSPAGKAMYAQALQQRVNPFVALETQGPDGTVTKNFVRPPMAPAAPVGALSDTPPSQPQGGQTPPASGGFPRVQSAPGPVLRRKSK